MSINNINVFSTRNLIVVFLFIIALILAFKFAMCGNAIEQGCDNTAIFRSLQELSGIIRKSRYQLVHDNIFPPCYSMDEDGNPMHSWRALLIREALFSEQLTYNYSVPWNHPNNQSSAKMSYFTSDIWSSEEGETHFVMIIPEEKLGPKDTPFLIIAIVPNTSIKWTEPKDLTLSELVRFLKKLHSQNPSLLPQKDGFAGCLLVGEDLSYRFLTIEGVLIPHYKSPDHSWLRWKESIIVPDYWEAEPGNEHLYRRLKNE